MIVNQRRNVSFLSSTSVLFCVLAIASPIVPTAFGSGPRLGPDREKRMPTEAEFKEQCRAVKDCHTAELLAFGVNYPNPGEFVPEDKRIKLNCGLCTNGNATTDPADCPAPYVYAENCMVPWPKDDQNPSEEGSSSDKPPGVYLCSYLYDQWKSNYLPTNRIPCLTKVGKVVLGVTENGTESEEYLPYPKATKPVVEEKVDNDTSLSAYSQQCAAVKTCRDVRSVNLKFFDLAHTLNNKTLCYWCETKGVGVMDPKECGEIGQAVVAPINYLHYYGELPVYLQDETFCEISSQVGDTETSQYMYGKVCSSLTETYPPRRANVKCFKDSLSNPYVYDGQGRELLPLKKSL